MIVVKIILSVLLWFYTMGLGYELHKETIDKKSNSTPVLITDFILLVITLVVFIYY